MYRYIALLDGRARLDCTGRFQLTLRELGLQHRVTFGYIDLYASGDTPVLPLPSGGALIGHIFPREDDPNGVAGLSYPRSSQNLVETLISKCWGEYLLLHQPGDDPDATTILRDPSGGVDCVYSARELFITSDVSIATRLGLYRRDIDWDFIHSNLTYPHHKAGRTGLVGLRELLPGCQLRISKKQHYIGQAWSPWSFVTPEKRHCDQREAQAAVRGAVAFAVRRLAEADQSLLLELSGGLDSSIVAACLQDTSARVACCNLVTPVPGADERQYASLMAEVLGVALNVERLPFDATPLDFRPPAHAVAPSTWFLQHAANELNEAIGARLGVNSFFSGGGGDTVFCYSRTAAPAADAFKECGMVAGARTVRHLAELHQCTFWKAGRLALRKLLAPPKPPRKPDTSFLSASLGTAMLESHPWFAAPKGVLPGDRERIFDLAGTQVFRDGLARGAKRHIRMPLLSQPVVEACLRVPSWMWIAGGRNRAVARDAFEHVLPPGILYRRSKGTFMNYSGAVYQQSKNQLREYLLTGQLEARGLLDADALRQFFNHNLSSRDDRFMRIFDLCAAENWVRHQV